MPAADLSGTVTGGVGLVGDLSYGGIFETLELESPLTLSVELSSEVGAE